MLAAAGETQSQTGVQAQGQSQGHRGQGRPRRAMHPVCVGVRQRRETGLGHRNSPSRRCRRCGVGALSGLTGARTCAHRGRRRSCHLAPVAAPRLGVPGGLHSLFARWLWCHLILYDRCHLYSILSYTCPRKRRIDLLYTRQR